MSKGSPRKSIGRAAGCCEPLDELLEPRLFRALGDPNRIALLSRLSACCRPCCVSEMAECCPVDLSVVSRHLSILREAGVIEGRRCGKEVQYTVRYDRLAQTFRRIAESIEACCASGACEPEEDHQDD